MRRTTQRTEIRPVVGMGRQAMVHMDSPQFKGVLIAQRQQGVQQDHRIEPARESQHQPRVRGDVADEAVRHDCDDRSIWQGFP